MSARCDDCGKIWPEDELKEPKRLSERLDPGGVVPSGECPDCGALAYPTPEVLLMPNDESVIAYQGTPTYGQKLTWVPFVTKDGQAGIAVKRLETDQEEFLYFNPSIDECTVFVYHGSELDTNTDPTEVFIDVAVDWDTVPLVENEGEGKKYLVVGIIDDFGKQDEPKTVREFFRAKSPEAAYDAAIAAHNTIVIAGIFFEGELVREGWPEDRRVR